MKLKTRYKMVLEYDDTEKVLPLDEEQIVALIPALGFVLEEIKALGNAKITGFLGFTIETEEE